MRKDTWQQGASLCIVAAVIGCAGLPWKQEAKASYPLPQIKKDCAICHVVEGEKTTAATTKKPSELCLDCHRDRVAPSEHKVDVVPAMPVKGLPLTDGKMTCITCHDPHANPYGSLLRMKPRDLCIVCHPM